jgi:hypothetical protein
MDYPVKEIFFVFLLQIMGIDISLHSYLKNRKFFKNVSGTKFKLFFVLSWKMLNSRLVKCIK